MKKSCLLITFLIVFKVCGNAQKIETGFSYNSNVTGELSYYPNPSKLETKSPGTEYRFGYGFSLIGKFQMNKHFSFQTGINYIYSGTKSKIYDNAYFPNEFVKSQYFTNNKDICLPLLLNYRCSSTKNHSFYAVFGASLAYNFERKLQSRNLRPDNTFVDNFYDPRDDNYRKWNINPSFGIGYDYIFKNKIKFFVQPNLEFNLLKTNGTAYPNKSIYNLGINVGFLIL